MLYITTIVCIYTYAYNTEFETGMLCTQQKLLPKPYTDPSR